MISRIDHVSMAVRDYEKALDLFQNVLGAVAGYGDTDDGLNFFWRVFSLGDLSRLEILKPTQAGGLLDGFLKKKAGGVHHITLQTPDIAEARETLRAHGIPFFGENEYEEFYWKEIFIHPKDTQGILVQIAEFNPDDWLSPSEKMPPGKKWAVKQHGQGCTLTFAHPGGGRAAIELDPAEVRELIADLGGEAGAL